MPHFPPEWSPHEGVWIGFPSDPALWLDDLAPAQDQVAAFARAVCADGVGETVRLVCANEAAAGRALALTTGADIHIVPFYDIWLRDTGPIVLCEPNGERIALDYRGNGWGGKYPSPLDDTLAELLSIGAGLPREPRAMILEGGAIDVDGQGWLVTTEQCLLNPNRNPLMSREDVEAQLRFDLGIKHILWLGDGLVADHTDGHVDNLARFIGLGVLALPEAAGRDDPNRLVYEDAWRRAAAAGLTCVPMPSPGRIEIAGEIAAASYMNFYIGNAVVVVPQHGAPNDEAALAVLKPYFPDRLVVGLPTDHILTGGGSFHCISQQVPQ